VQNLSKSPYSTSNIYNLIFLMFFILPKFHNHVFYINFDQMLEFFQMS